MLDLLFSGITELGTSEIENVLTRAGESAIKQYKDASSWKKILVDTGKFFVENENDENAFFADLAIVLSRENMALIAKDLRHEDGYKLKHKLYDSLMQLMQKYEIPYEVAESYSFRIMYVVLEQLRYVEPAKYEHYFFQDWREEQEKCFYELRTRLDKMASDLAVYKQNDIDILSSGQMDLNLRKSTNPSLGIGFFIVDDGRFQDEFEEKRFDELIFVRGRCIEETIYCVLNELWKLNEKRPIYVIRSIDSWNKLQSLETSNNIYIPNFYSDEIVAIDNNTNIFVLNENTPAYTRNVLELRPRTIATISSCLRSAGMEQEKVAALLTDTHGLYIPMKKHLFKGEYLKQPKWIEKISNRAQKTGLLVGQWEETEGDKLIIEKLYGDTYENYIEEVMPYTIGEDPFLYVFRRNGTVAYYLASTENSWSCINVLMSEPVWKKFVSAVIDVLNESENLFTYDYKERTLAHFNGEQLFWSETIRKGMLKTLMIKGAYRKEDDSQTVLNSIVLKILEYVQTEKQWSYISTFWTELCEIAPEIILDRLEKEEKESTGLTKLFENQTSDFLFGRNAYINILWGVEQFLVQPDYFWRAFRWLSIFDKRTIEYKSNSPKDIFDKVLCPWYNFSVLSISKDRIKAAEVLIEINPDRAWNYICSAIDNRGSIMGALSTPKYRCHIQDSSVTMAEFAKTIQGYLALLLKHMEFSADRWIQIIAITENLSDEKRKAVFGQLLYEIKQMSDEEVIAIKDSIRDIIYKHRYFASSSWAMSEEKVCEFEKLLSEIHTSLPEYEYGYLFTQNGNHPLSNPVPYDADGNYEKNKIAAEKVIENKIYEFNDLGYDLQLLAQICSRTTHSTLGQYLARYWKKGKWDYATFKVLLSAQKSGQIAIDYMSHVLESNPELYTKLIEQVTSENYPDEIISKIYRAEAFITTNIPLVSHASDKIKQIFWESPIYCNEKNSKWVLTESKNYSTLNTYLDMLHRVHYQNPLSAQEIYDYLDGIEKMPHSQGNQMTSYHVEQLLAVIQDEYLDDSEKCFKIAQMEILFANLIGWDHMRCFSYMIKKSPDLIAQLMSVIFKHDHQQHGITENNKTILHNMYTIYEKAHFCPAEENGYVAEDKIEQWVERFKFLLEQNDQTSLFSSALGRLFSFSPIGADGHEPCEAVRTMIEKYGDEKMIRRYQTCVYNRRGIFSPSAGKEELEMAKSFKANAVFLEPNYPTTAKIFYGLAETYNRESEHEREDAENGWY